MIALNIAAGIAGTGNPGRFAALSLEFYIRVLAQKESSVVPWIRAPRTETVNGTAESDVIVVVKRASGLFSLTIENRDSES